MSPITPTCAAVREAVSARLDAEPSPLAPDTVDAHLDRCEECRRYTAATSALVGRSRVNGAHEVPDLSASIVAAVVDAEAAPDRRTHQLRWVVGLAGVAQLVVGLALVLGIVEAGGHLGRDLGAFELALGVGFLFAAWQPHRTSGVLPVAVVVAATVLAASTLDLATGRATLLMELPHLSELVGVAALWALGRRERPGPAMRPVEAR